MQRFGLTIVLSTVITATIVRSRDVDPLGKFSTDHPLVIAHRGSSGQLPEHTVEAYQLAVQQGADVIECDLAVTKDQKLICTHETNLNHTTDVADKFPDRLRTYYIAGFQNTNVTDYFTIDFTLEELKTLRKVQNRPYRNQAYNGMFEIATFDEYVAVAKNSNNSRTVGIYPETKIPDFFNAYLAEFNTTMEDILLDSLDKHGYNFEDSPCFIQSFDVTSVRYMAERTKAKLVFLIEEVITDEKLEELSSFVYGIGAWKQAVVEINYDTRRVVRVTNFMTRVQRYNYKVHLYTMRNEDEFLAFDYAGDPYNEYEQLLSTGVNGLFTDFPATMVNYLDIRETREKCGAARAGFYPVTFIFLMTIANMMLSA